MSRKPVLYPDLMRIWEIWWILHGTRRIGMAANPISVTDTVSCLDLFGVADPQDRRDVFRFVHAMDAAWFRWLEDHRDEEAKKKKKEKGKK